MAGQRSITPALGKMWAQTAHTRLLLGRSSSSSSMLNGEQHQQRGFTVELVKSRTVGVAAPHTCTQVRIYLAHMHMVNCLHVCSCMHTHTQQHTPPYNIATYKLYDCVTTKLQSTHASFTYTYIDIKHFC